MPIFRKKLKNLLAQEEEEEEGLYLALNTTCPTTFSLLQFDDHPFYFIIRCLAAGRYGHEETC